LDGDIFFLISLREIAKMTCRSEEYSAAFGGKTLFAQPRILSEGCVKRVFTALLAKLNLDGDIFFLISRSENAKMMCRSEEYSAAAGGENLFTQPRILSEGCVKSLFMALLAKLNLDGDIFFLISRSEIAKMTCRAQKNILLPQAAKTFLRNP
jgi:hypothetical protein